MLCGCATGELPQYAPASAEPQFFKVGKLMTASWTAAGKTYVLAGPGDEDALRKFVRSDF